MRYFLYFTLFVCFHLSAVPSEGRRFFKAGDQVELPNGDVFTLDSLLNSNGKGQVKTGSTTDIFSVVESDHIAIRVDRPPFEENYVLKTVQGYQALKDQGVPTVQVLFYSNSYDWAAVERVKPRFYLRDFLRDPFQWNDVERAEMVESLKNFARRAALFKSIGDLNAGQIVWVEGRGWVLLDWTDEHVLNEEFVERPYGLEVPNIVFSIIGISFDDENWSKLRFLMNLERTLVDEVYHARYAQTCASLMDKISL